MADVIGHPWMRGEIATKEAVQKEFAQRQHLIQQQDQAEREFQQQARAQNQQKQGEKKYQSNNAKALMAANPPPGQGRGRGRGMNMSRGMKVM